MSAACSDRYYLEYDMLCHTGTAGVGAGGSIEKVATCGVHNIYDSFTDIIREFLRLSITIDPLGKCAEVRHRNVCRTNSSFT